MHVLVTGAGGHLGRKLFDYLTLQPNITVSGLDISPVDHPNIYEADFGGEPNWTDYLNDVDVIVHFAGDREPSATWESAVRNNMDATLTLYHFAVKKNVSRFILASSNWVFGDKRFTDDVLNSKTNVGPINAYGMSKLFGERVGKYFAENHGVSVICLRIGWTQWTHDNKPGTHMAMGRWGQEMWLSDEDFLNGVLAAILTRNVSFATLNLMSNNPGMRWDLEETRQLIGYSPKDGSEATITHTIKFKSWIKKIITVSLPAWFNMRFPDW